jgi:SAM-dependent methyltransferase
MLQLYFTHEGRDFLPVSGRALHFAPEECVRKIMGERDGLHYFIADRDSSILQGKNAQGFRTDMLEFAVKDDSLDLIFCIHVLEHVHDDLRAVQELLRALKPGGRVVIMVPFDDAAQNTVEWEHARENMFGHVRAYSRKDFATRLKPFEVEEIAPETFLSEAERKMFGIPPKEVIYLCSKPIM